MVPRIIVSGGVLLLATLLQRVSGDTALFPPVTGTIALNKPTAASATCGEIQPIRYCPPDGGACLVCDATCPYGRETGSFPLLTSIPQVLPDSQSSCFLNELKIDSVFLFSYRLSVPALRPFQSRQTPRVNEQLTL